ncbi:hypothetical protein RIF29_07075 [Crotalaria pallida]|uniref:Uncharacterized protein n=1 Tax=Crotalaria pallida TaxID=3830 RepID=A0AAN9PAM9_CROPI
MHLIRSTSITGLRILLVIAWLFYSYVVPSKDISSQVATYMRDPSRMMKQMQLRRSAVSIFGSVPEVKDDFKEYIFNLGTGMLVL